MLAKCAHLLASQLLRNINEENSKKEIYEYGSQLLLSTLGCICFILLISTILSVLPVPLLFLSVFFTLRLFAGGFHASTYGRCFILSNFVCFFCVFLSFFLNSQNEISYVVTSEIILAAVSTAIIFILAPIRHKNHPLSEARYNRNRRIARSLVLVDFSAALLAVAVGSTLCAITISVTLTAVAVMMIIPTFFEGRKEL